MPAKNKNNPPGIVVIVGDLHTNSTTGLAPPRVELDDGGEYRANKFQLWLWDKWLRFWEEMAQHSQALDLPLITVINGDATDGDHHNTSQIITRNPATMLRIAAEVVKPALDVSDCWYITRGTASHVGESCWLEEKLAEDIGAERPPDSNAWSWWHLPLLVGGVLFDIQHHPESGDMRPWTRGAGAGRIAAIVTYDYARDRRIPDVAIRNHRHKWGDSGTNHPVRAFQIPAWQGPTGFVHRIGVGGQLPEFGGIYFVCRDGGYTWDRRVFRPARRRPVSPELNNGQ